MKKQFVHVHLLVSYTNALTQRDRDGNQKRGPWAGADRAYISSAQQKRETRRAWEESLPVEMRAVRTRQHQQVAAKLTAERGWDPDQAEEATRALWAKMTGGKGDKDSDGGLAFLRADALDSLVDLADEHHDLMALLARAEFPPVKVDKDAPAEDKEQYKTDKELHKQAVAALKDKARDAEVERICNQVLDVTGNVSVAMFGRMIAARPEHNVDTPFKAAHALGLEPWSDENIDFFSAVDDLAEDGGSGHINSADLSSTAYYRYGVFDVGQLCANLGYEEPDKDVATWIAAAVEQFALALPASKQSSTAANAWPLWVGVDISGYALGNGANTFVKPVGNSYDASAHERAAQDLIDRRAAEAKAYRPGEGPLRYVTVLDGLEPNGAERVESLAELGEYIRTEVAF